MSDNQKMIRFIDSEYNTLFWIPNGENIVLTFSNGKRAVRNCLYLDEYHTRVGCYNTYHICEFAEAMERNGTKYAPETAPELPEMCFCVMPNSGELVVVTRGERGYRPCGFSTSNPLTNEREAVNLNARNHITRQMAAAMLSGSMFGWDTPASNPSNYDFYGNAVQPTE